MVQSLIWAGLVALGAALAWLASARLHQRRLDALEVQIKVLRQTLHANSDQARRQIGQLQAELAARPPAPCAPGPAATEAVRRKPATPDRYVTHEDGFPQTAVIGDHFPKTMLMR